MSKQVVAYLPEGFADWEGAFLFPELRQNGYSVIYASDDGKPVESIGGLMAVVDGSVSTIRHEDTTALILIGSDTWVDPSKNQAILKLTREFLSKGTAVGAICAATAALAREGMLEGRPHTSNDIAWLRHVVPSYRDEKFYRDELVVRDRNLVTAPGVAPLEFALELMAMLGIYSEEKRHHWFALYKHGTKPPADFWS